MVRWVGNGNNDGATLAAAASSGIMDGEPGVYDDVDNASPD